MKNTHRKEIDPKDVLFWMQVTFGLGTIALSIATLCMNGFFTYIASLF